MPRTVDHIVATHHLAQERRDAGLPIWDRKLNVADVFRNDEMSFEERRDAVVARIRRSGWIETGNWNLSHLVDGLASAEAVEEFDGWWDEIYDEADADRVWIETR
jgi:hypothetical protein